MCRVCYGHLIDAAAYCTILISMYQKEWDKKKHFDTKYFDVSVKGKEKKMRLTVNASSVVDEKGARKHYKLGGIETLDLQRKLGPDVLVVSKIHTMNKHYVAAVRYFNSCLDDLVGTAHVFLETGLGRTLFSLRKSKKKGYITDLNKSYIGRRVILLRGSVDLVKNLNALASSYSKFLLAHRDYLDAGHRVFLNYDFGQIDLQEKYYNSLSSRCDSLAKFVLTCINRVENTNDYASDEYNDDD